MHACRDTVDRVCKPIATKPAPKPAAPPPQPQQQQQQQQQQQPAPEGGQGPTVEEVGGTSWQTALSMQRLIDGQGIEPCVQCSAHSVHHSQTYSPTCTPVKQAMAADVP